MERIDATPGVAGSTSAEASPWLARLPAVLFAVPVGRFGLAAAWRRARGSGWSLAEPVGVALAWTAAALAVASTVISVLAARTVALIARGRLLAPSGKT